MSEVYVFVKDRSSSAASEDPLKVTIEDVKPVVACRGCLVTAQPLRLLDGKLANAYKLFISTVEESDIYPMFFCIYCCALLRKFMSFREKCLFAQSTLKEISSTSIPITLKLKLIKSRSKISSYPFKVSDVLLINVGNEKSTQKQIINVSSSTSKQNVDKRITNSNKQNSLQKGPSIIGTKNEKSTQNENINGSSTPMKKNLDEISSHSLIQKSQQKEPHNTDDIIMKKIEIVTNKEPHNSVTMTLDNITNNNTETEVEIIPNPLKDEILISDEDDHNEYASYDSQNTDLPDCLSNIITEQEEPVIEDQQNNENDLLTDPFSDVDISRVNGSIENTSALTLASITQKHPKKKPQKKIALHKVEKCNKILNLNLDRFLQPTRQEQEQLNIQNKRPLIEELKLETNKENDMKSTDPVTNQIINPNPVTDPKNTEKAQVPLKLYFMAPLRAFGLRDSDENVGEKHFDNTYIDELITELNEIRGSVVTNDEIITTLNDMRQGIDTVMMKPKKYKTCKPPKEINERKNETGIGTDSVKAIRKKYKRKRTKPKVPRLTKMEKYILKRKTEFEKKNDAKIVELSKEQQIQQYNERKDSELYRNATFKCDNCNFGCFWKFMLEGHMARHELKVGHVLCEICKRSFPTSPKTCSTVDKIPIHYHILRCHKYNYICNQCGHVSKHRAAATQHNQTQHKDVQYDCKICGKKFKKKTSVMAHMLIHKDALVPCSICGHQCNGPKGVRSHIRYSHKEAIGAVCASCGVQFHSVDALQRHLQIQDAHSDDTHRPCTACGMSFASDSLLRQHASTCESKKTYSCEKCSRSFEDQASFYKHIHRKCRRDYSANKDRRPRRGGHRGGRRGGGGGHRGGCGGRREPRPKTKQIQKIVICETCGKIVNYYQWDAHRRRQHTKETMCTCDYCGKGFFAKLDLENHINGHMGRRFQCRYCDKQFMTYSSRGRHEETLHKGKRFKCELCGGTFTTKKATQDHVRHTHQGVPWPKRVRNKHVKK